MLPTTAIPEGLIELLREASHVCVLTGAGVSAESGVPTFREVQSGLWSKYDPLELATPEAFERDPNLVADWYRWRRELVSKVEPNPGHFALAELQTRLPKLSLVTQNVDGLHQRAGSHGVIEYHGNLFVDRCSADGRIVDSPTVADGVETCPDCGARLRPGVVWFGESIPPEAVSGALAAAESCDVFFSVGTSSLVWPAAGLADAALRAGAPVVEINLADTDISEICQYRLTGKSGEVLPQLLTALAPGRHDS